MKKTFIVFCFFILLSSCALFPRKTHIIWPEKIEYLEALCDIDISWRDMKYSGSMSLKMKHPDRLQFEVYGPFGETVVYLAKNRDKFSFVSSDEKFSNEKMFEERFGIKLNEFIDDISFMNYRKEGRESVYFKRENYVVIYRLDNTENSICWKGKDGSICMNFLEAVFDEKEQ
ncbi:MAG: hypothetical protein NT010_05465 [Proteobacteria bacterium]|nr:hypothetical protein [Pseudomonadota bacterium]